MWREKRWLQGIFDPPSYVIKNLDQQSWIPFYFVKKKVFKIRILVLCFGILDVLCCGFSLYLDKKGI